MHGMILPNVGFLATGWMAAGTAFWIVHGETALAKAKERIKVRVVRIVTL
jgi:hypothetical protein